jgi:hypothetical protein
MSYLLILYLKYTKICIIQGYSAVLYTVEAA